MSRVILHVGTHKTGTTAFQEVMYANRRLLEARGVIYPDFGCRADHHGLVLDWIPSLPERYHIAGGAEAALRRLVADHGRSDRTVILSSEEFSRGSPASRADLAQVRQWLAGFERVEVLCAIRPQIAYLQSIFLQVMRDGRLLNWDLMVKQALNRHLATGLFLNYGDLDDYLTTGFAPEEITYLDYDQLRRAKGGTPAVLLSRIAPGIAFDSLALPHDGEVNGWSPEPLTSWAAAQISDPERPSAGLLDTMQHLIDAHRAAQTGHDIQPGGKSTIYARHQVRFMAERFGPLNQAFRDRIAARGGEVPALALEAPDDAIIHREDLGAGFFARAARHFYRHGPTGG